MAFHPLSLSYAHLLLLFGSTGKSQKLLKERPYLFFRHLNVRFLEETDEMIEAVLRIDLFEGICDITPEVRMHIHHHSRSFTAIIDVLEVYTAFILVFIGFEVECPVLDVKDDAPPRIWWRGDIIEDLKGISGRRYLAIWIESQQLFVDTGHAGF